ncbi:signal peptidase I [Cellulomonas massiliensis]|uniref:signal peptidase I n=1 Tax=Cellulomonas massiliensis TaxID=1465811 RepID=UPI00031D3D15|nr:signal peptidase I [Cellulomonas massiliensis]
MADAHDLEQVPDRAPDPAGRPARRRAWSAAGAVASAAALVVVVFLALVVVVVPLAMGAQTYTVLTGSMAPLMPPGTLVVTRPVDPARVEIGDVITYQMHSGEPEVVTHRVRGIGSTTDGELAFVTRGDANGADDPPVREVQVRGEVVYRVPYVGHLNAWVGANRPRWLTLAAAAGLIGYGAWLWASSLRDRSRARAASADAAGSPA